jgi:predicted branched-subunit amino acid permease
MIMLHDTPREVRTGARDISPLAAGVAIYGLAFGLLAAQAGFGMLQVGVMGGIVFAGGSQIVAAQQLVADAGAVAAIVAGLALNRTLPTFFIKPLKRPDIDRYCGHVIRRFSVEYTS